ncbi:MAG: hypothetical protein HGA19_13620 [Oscillochloris sp.]|nr:hypothetical protein [Oscillochloris sp.]
MDDCRASTIYIPDLHGDPHILGAITARALAHRQVRRWVFVGDYVDDGYHSLILIRQLAETDALRGQFARIFLAGNHDLALIYLLGRLQASRTPEARRRSFAEYFVEWGYGDGVIQEAVVALTDLQNKRYEQL